MLFIAAADRPVQGGPMHTQDPRRLRDGSNAGVSAVCIVLRTILVAWTAGTDGLTVGRVRRDSRRR